MEGTNKAHENGEAMGFVGVRLTVMLGCGYCFWLVHLMCETTLAHEVEGVESMDIMLIYLR